jgi:hypothetical protein
MIDITLSILALVAGGFSLELFTTHTPAATPGPLGSRIEPGSRAFEEVLIGNPS